MQGGPVTFTSTFTGTTVINQFLDTAKYGYFHVGHSNICDSNGNLVLCSDGYNVYDRNLNLIEDGDTLVPTLLYLEEDGWSAYAQSSLFLPFSNGKYYFVTPVVSDSVYTSSWMGANPRYYFDQVLYDVIDMNANGGAGKVTRRVVPLLTGKYLSRTQMMACKHGNGKDWWVLKQGQDSNIVYKFLFRQDTVLGPYEQHFAGMHFTLIEHEGQSVFTRDGAKYATTCLGAFKIFLADFDRCAGNLSNPKIYDVPILKDVYDSNYYDGTASLAFSPNGRYVYVGGRGRIQQLDLQDSNPQTRWTAVAGPDTTLAAFQMYSTMYVGPDDKLYIGNRNGFSSAMSVINNPNNKGTACNFCPKCLRFPLFAKNGFTYPSVSCPPNMPNYALGPTNPICWPTAVNETATPVFRLYPNPSLGMLQIEYTAEGLLLLTDMTGRIVRTVVLPGGKSKISTDLMAVTPGIYLYRYVVKGIAQAAGKLTVH